MTNQERLVTIIRDRAFDELEQARGELHPMALWIDEDGRIGVVSVYAGRDFPEPDAHLIDVRAALTTQTRRQPTIVGVATAHRERTRLPGTDDPFETVCVHYESRTEGAVRVYFPYRINKKLSGPSEITAHAPVSIDGTPAIFSKTR